VRIVIEVLDALGVEGARPANDAVHFVALVDEKLAEVRPVLSSDARDKGALCSHR
jgi:hypothetical protein